MNLESMIRYSEEGYMRRALDRSALAHGYGTPHPFEDAQVDWRWMELWEQENPHPINDPDIDMDTSLENQKEWNTQSVLMQDRCWLQFHFPKLRIMDWSEEDVKALRNLMLGHICGVCGRADDPGCSAGC